MVRASTYKFLGKGAKFSLEQGKMPLRAERGVEIWKGRDEVPSMGPVSSPHEAPDPAQGRDIGGGK